MATALDIITDAFRELAVVDPIDPVPGEMAAFGLNKLNRLLNRWNARRTAVYADVTTLYTLTPSLNPHTIGPTGATWTVTQRPVDIDHLAVVQSGIYSTLDKRDDVWWREISQPGMTGPVPSDWKYEPTYPNGSLYLWPIPSAALQVALTSRMVLSALTLASTFTMPPAYQDAVTLSLAESLAPAMGAQIAPELRESARQARVDAFANNDSTPKLMTVDVGMGGRGYFDFNSGTFR